MVQNSPDSNNTLYFIVGGLVVIAVIFGIFLYNSNYAIDNSALAPAAGVETTTTTTSTPDNTPAVTTEPASQNQEPVAR